MLPEQISAQMLFILSEEGIDYEESALNLLARSADGSLRDGLSLLDQAIAFGNGEVRLDTVTNMLGAVAQQPVDELLIALVNNNAVDMLQKIADISELTPDFSEILQQILRVLHRVALVQAVPAFNDKQFDSNIVKQLAENLLAEDVQLFYQIGLLGQRDLELAPDARGGFEMVMLRMLTFKPETVKGATALLPVADKKVAVQAVNKVVESNSLDAVVEERQLLEKAMPAGESEWAEMVVAMKVRGMTRELANNCVLESIDESNCYLVLTPGHSQLISPRAQEKLQQALQQYCGKPIKLHIKTEETNNVTPAQQIIQKREDIQQSAVDSINADEGVQALKESFDARVMPGTIEPIPENNK